MNRWTHTRVALPGDTGFDRWRLDSGAPGPHVVVFGGTHGDETEGAIAANRLAGSALDLISGSLEVIPIVHEAAYFADRRTSPLDHRDLARSFPGSEGGTATQRLAHALSAQVLATADLLIDLHTSGQAYEIPFIAGYIDDGRDKRGLAARAARAFGADFVWRHPERPPGRTLSGLDAAIYTEAPCPGPTDLGYVDRYVAGVERVLAELRMLASQPAPAAAALRLVSGGDVDSDMQCVSTAGLFIPKARCGAKVAKGQVLGVVTDRRGVPLQEIRADCDGWVVVLKRRPHVKAGDRVVAVAIADK
jgi:predicted deacylase